MRETDELGPEEGPVNQGRPFVFVFPLPHEIIALLLLLASYQLVLAIFLLILSIKRGFFADLIGALIIGLLLLVMMVGSAFAFWLTLPSRSWLPFVEVTRSGLKFFPDLLRKVFGEKPVERNIPPDTAAVLFCQDFSSRAGIRYKVIFRGPDDADSSITVDWLNRLSLLDARQLQNLAEGIAGNAGIPVRFVVRNQLEDGAIKEMPWNALKQSAHLGLTVGFAAGLAPFATGFVVGRLVANPLTIVVAGLLTWVAQILVVSGAWRAKSRSSRYPVFYALFTLFTSSACYAAAFAFDNHIFHPQ
jgi:hypothetical protein